MTETVLDDLRMVNAACEQLMSAMPDNSVDFILTDIPYELEAHGGKGNNEFSSRALVKDHILDFVSNGIDYEKIFPEFVRLCKKVNCCIFCSNKQVGKIMLWWEKRGYVATLLVWDKPNPIPLCNGTYISNLEFIVYVREKGSTFNNLGYKFQLKSFHFPAPTTRIHETEKPVMLLRQLLLLHTKAGDTVFDPYAGSFSTAIACLREKRKFVGCEVLEKYYQPAVKRIRMELKQKTLF